MFWSLGNNDWFVLLLLRPFGEDEVIPLLDRVSERGQTIGEGIQRSQNFLQNYVPRAPGKTRELSPDLLELQAEIDAIR